MEIDSFNIWCIAGVAGAGKTTLFNFLTNSKDNVFNGLLQGTTEINAKGRIMEPLRQTFKNSKKSKEINRFFSDTEGIGLRGFSENYTDVVSQTLIRIIHGATGVILCLKMDRLTKDDIIIVMNIFKYCYGIPIIFCLTKYDEKFKKHNAIEWVKSQREIFLNLFHPNNVPKDIDYINEDKYNICVKKSEFCTISIHKKDVSDLMNILTKYDNEHNFINEEIRNIKDENKFKDSEKINDENFTKTYAKISTRIKNFSENIGRSPWYIEVLKAIPGVGTITTVIDNVIVYNNKSDKKKQSKK